MKIKTKLTLGVGLLFMLIVLQILVGAKYINALKEDTENILIDNYISLEYSRNMLKALDEGTPQSLKIFESNLTKQLANTTEIGEKEATTELANNFEVFKNKKNDVLLPLMRNEIYTIMILNMQAIERKNVLANNTSKTAFFYITVTGALSFLIAFVLLINLPANIANPIKELTNSIKQIADKKYSERVHFETHSEFGELATSFNSMAQKLEEYNNSNLAKLMMEKRRIETLINNMQDPVIGLNEKMKIIFANEEAIKIIGINRDDLVGKSAKDIAVHNDLVRSLMKDLISPEKPVSNNGKRIQPFKIYANGKESYFEKVSADISFVPTGEQNETIVGYVIILRNVTEYKELDFAKTNFIATISHEFKTPISSIKMSLQLLDTEKIGKLNDEQKNLLTGIKDDTNRMLKITGELLNIAQVESGNIQLSIIPSDAKEILSYAINANKIQAEQKKIKLEVNCPDTLPKVLADSEKTTWVLTNLISNAIRYSYENSTIYLMVSPENNNVLFSVKDTGQGISPEYKDKVFDRYFRVPGTKKEGTGLGLAISKEFIEAQGGQINVESEFAAGSTFKVILKTA